MPRSPELDRSAARRPIRFRVRRACLLAASSLAGLAILAALPAWVGAQTRIQTRPAPEVFPQREPDDIEHALREAGILLRQGQTEAGIQRLQALVDKNPQSWRAVQTLGRTLESLGRMDDGIEVYRAAVERLEEPAPALFELERLYRLDSQWVKALEVCMEALDRVPDSENWVANEIESMIRSDKLGPEAVAFLEQVVRDRKKDLRLQEILASAYLHQDRDRDALELILKLDSKSRDSSGVLFRFARLAEDKRHNETALAAYDAVLESEPREVVTEEIHYRKAQILLRMGRVDEAVASLDAAAAAAPDGRWGSRAGIEKAEILAQRLHRYEEALTAYQQVLEQLLSEADSQGRPRSQRSVQRDARAADEVRLKMAECRLQMGQADKAAELYQILADEAKDPETRFQARYQVGELLFYQGRLKDAEDAWYRLLDDDPKQEWANDALARILMVGENSDEGGVPLTALALAEYQSRLGHLERGLTLIDEALTEYPESRAADDLLLERTRILLDLGRVPEARASADTLAARFPESVLGPKALLQVAEHLVALPDQKTEAQALYLEVILRAPDSLEAVRAREALQSLKEKPVETSALEPLEGNRVESAAPGPLEGDGVMTSALEPSAGQTGGNLRGYA